MQIKNTQKQLTIRSDEAYFLARELAEQENKAIGQLVVEALRALAAERKKRNDAMDPETRANFQRLRALSRKFAPRWPHGFDSSHDFLYDEDGLPV